MLVSLDFTVICTIDDQFELPDMARREVLAIKPPDDQPAYLPDGPTSALQILIRTAIANRLLSLTCVTLHQIDQKIGPVTFDPL